MHSRCFYGHWPIGIATTFPELRDLTLHQSQLLDNKFKGQFLPQDEPTVNKVVVSGLIALKQLQKLTITDALEDSPCHKIAQNLLLDLQRIDKQDKVLVLESVCETKTVVLQYCK
jgi:hypothetical protein